MKRKLRLMGLLGLLMIFGGSLFAQGLEDFTNSNATSNYGDDTFIGNGGISWTYGHSRDEGDYPITNEGLMLRRASDSYLQATIPGGVGSFSLEYRKAFTGGSARQLELLVNDVQVATSPEFGVGSGEDPTVHTFTVENINATGNVVIKIKNVGATSTNRQTTIDNISWTGYTGGGTPQAATPTFTPGTGTYFTAQDVVIESATPGATIYYTTNGDEPDNTSTEYTAAVNVSTTTTLKAIAYAAGFDPSNVGSATYTFETVNEVADIATLRAGTTGETYKLTGEALLSFQTASRNAKYIQDASGAILIDDYNGVITTIYAIGDGITGITGTLAVYQNMIQFVPTMDPGVPTSQGNVLTPVSVTLANLDDSYQAKLVKISNATFSDAGNFASGQNYPITDPSGSGVIRTQYYDLDYIGEAIPTDPQDITGVILQYNTTMQLIPRSLNDFETVAAATPIVTVDPASLTGFTYEEGNGPSASQSFTVEGSDLTADVIITPSANYEISEDDVSFQSTAITLTETAGTVTSTLVYARLKAGLSTGDYNGEEIIVSSAGATDQVVTLSGSVTEALVGFVEDFTNSNATGSYG
ncbi:MAG: chitobiase/beta-hexosaminidase C-terminal domain-containing protein, partial [Bacteroidales bacterium]|nr:chitobiase/beta-hexosaminidase C-terminal domain-containing protein [Bacteroidales bacterium]